MNLKVPPLALLLLMAACMKVVSELLPFLGFSMPGNSLLGGSVVLAGGAIAVMGVLEFRRANTTVDPRNPQQSASLVGSGVYKISRNPMYLGFLMMLFGWFIIISNLAAVVFLPLFVVYLNQFQIKPEERFLKEKFGAGYSEYCSKVRRWL